MAVKRDYFAYFETHYIMPVVMIAGGLLGGATSEGGGAVAFSVMTLGLGLHPDVARDFLFVTQTAGRVERFATTTTSDRKNFPEKKLISR